PVSPAFPTRRSSDLGPLAEALDPFIERPVLAANAEFFDHVAGIEIEEATGGNGEIAPIGHHVFADQLRQGSPAINVAADDSEARSEEHTSELQSPDQ